MGICSVNGDGGSPDGFVEQRGGVHSLPSPYRLERRLPTSSTLDFDPYKRSDCWLSHWTFVWPSRGSFGANSIYYGASLLYCRLLSANNATISVGKTISMV